jgi:hypothetical protein
MEHYVRPDGLPPVSGYSHAVAFTERMVAVSGQVPTDRDGRLVGPGDPAAQVRQVGSILSKSSSNAPEGALPVDTTSLGTAAGRGAACPCWTVGTSAQNLRQAPLGDRLSSWSHSIG